MSRLCAITLKKPLRGNNVSHANNKTNRFFFPNVHWVTLKSSLLNKTVSMRLTPKGMKTIDKYGGLDSFLTLMPKRRLEGEMLKLKKEIMKLQKD